MTVKDNAEKLLTPIIEGLGYEVVEIRYEKAYGEDNLTIFIFKKGGINFDDCEKVNAELSAVLDENDITSGQVYNFNVSSPGLDRPVVTADDYRRSLDTELELIFCETSKKKSVHGMLISYTDSAVALRINGKEVSFDKGSIKLARPYINFK